MIRAMKNREHESLSRGITDGNGVRRRGAGLPSTRPRDLRPTLPPANLRMAVMAIMFVGDAACAAGVEHGHYASKLNAKSRFGRPFNFYPQFRIRSREPRPALQAVHVGMYCSPRSLLFALL